MQTSSFLRPLALGVLLLGPTALRAESPSPKLASGDTVAICGDSITEQRLYSMDMETYLLACQPAAKLQAAQFGWGGETISGFKDRMVNDVLLPFNSTVVTLCYGMNDGGYVPTDEKKLATFRKDLTAVLQTLKSCSVHTVIVGSPGAVDTTTFKSFFGTSADVYNRTLADFGDAAKEVAAQEGTGAGDAHETTIGFADVHGLMLDVMAKAKAKYGRDYVLAGKDGIHPDANGHLVMAYAFLKAMGCDGNVGALTLDMATGEGTASDGHRVLAASKNSLQVESTRYPFCFHGDPAKPDSTSGVVEFLPFNQDLNRFTFLVKNAPAGRLKVTWGEQSKEFDAAALAQGVNLAAEFLDNPFSEPFKQVENAVRWQQSYETPKMKEILHHVPTWRKASPGKNKAFDALESGLAQADDALRETAVATVTPVRHEIRVEAVGN